MTHQPLNTNSEGNQKANAVELIQKTDKTNNTQYGWCGSGFFSLVELVSIKYQIEYLHYAHTRAHPESTPLNDGLYS